jgi:hypothetical protein
MVRGIRLGSVSDFVIQPNGKIIVGGKFTFVSEGGDVIMNLAQIERGPLTTLPVINAPRSAVAGAQTTLSVKASGDSLTYQWQLHGMNIAGATGATYTIPSVQSFHAGS